MVADSCVCCNSFSFVIFICSVSQVCHCYCTEMVFSPNWNLWPEISLDQVHQPKKQKQNKNKNNTKKTPIPLVTAAVNSPSHQLLSELAAMLQIRILKSSVLLRWHPWASRVPEPLSSSPRPKTCRPLPPASHARYFFFLWLCLFKGGQRGRTSAGGEGPQPSVWESASPPAALPGEDHGNNHSTVCYRRGCWSLSELLHTRQASTFTQGHTETAGLNTQVGCLATYLILITLNMSNIK